MWEFSGARITIAREVHGISLAELAKKAGVAHAQLSDWEAGKVTPGQEALMKICNTLKVRPEFFFVYSGNDANG
jgi:transcriptional regulator with XRE-family HTH domain